MHRAGPDRSGWRINLRRRVDVALGISNELSATSFAAEVPFVPGMRSVVCSLCWIDRHSAHRVFYRRRSRVFVLMPVPIFVFAMRHDSPDPLMTLLPLHLDIMLGSRTILRFRAALTVTSNMSAMRLVASVPMMHEEVHQRAGEEQRIRQNSERVLPVVFKDPEGRR
jgi:hypothetical protein